MLQGLLKVSKARGCRGPGIGGTGRSARHQRSPENVRVPSSRQMAWDRRACRSDHMDESGRRARVKSANATTRSRQTIKLLLGPAWPVRNVTSNAAPAEKRGSSNVRRGLENLYISYISVVYKIKIKLNLHFALSCWQYRLGSGIELLGRYCPSYATRWMTSKLRPALRWDAILSTLPHV